MVHKIKSIIHCLLSFFICQSCLAASTTQNAMLWADIQTKGMIRHHKLAYLAQLHARLSSGSPIFNTGIVRLALGYPLSPTFSFWPGYDYVSSRDDSKNTLLIEQRIWQQVMWGSPWKVPGSLSFRSRLEERLKQTENDTAVRLRQKITLEMTNIKLSANTIPLFYEEIFFNLNHPKWIENKMVDQNRLFLGVKIRSGTHHTLTIGYINQIEFKNTTNNINHILLVSYAFS